MSRFIASLRHDAVALAVALVGVVAAEVLVRLLTHAGAQLPISILMVPVLCLALVAGGPATAVVAVAAVVFGVVEFERGDYATSELTLRLATLIIACAAAVALATGRSRRERTLRRQALALEGVRQREASEAVLSAMVDRLGELTAAPDVVSASRAACVLARDLFGADTVSYWHREGDEAVLWARHPDSDALSAGMRLPWHLLYGDRAPLEMSRTVWVRAGDDGDPARAELMRRAGSAAGTSTAVVLAGETIGSLSMSWSHDREQPDRFWLDALNRYADQVALAKTVIRRREAQNEAQSLARRFQAGLLPHLPRAGTVQVQSLYRPGLSQMLLGGDFLDARADEDGTVAFIIGDVAGHGPEQAALGTTLRGAWRGLACMPAATDQDIANALDTIVRENPVAAAGLFATAVIGRIDPHRRLLTYISAGHPPPLLLTGTAVVPGPAGDGVLGLWPDATYQPREVPVADGQGVLIVTDGLFEGRRTEGRAGRFDYDTFVAFLAGHGIPTGHRGLEELGDEMERQHGEPLPDDAAALLLILRAGD